MIVWCFVFKYVKHLWFGTFRDWDKTTPCISFQHCLAFEVVRLRCGFRCEGKGPRDPSPPRGARSPCPWICVKYEVRQEVSESLTFEKLERCLGILVSFGQLEVVSTLAGASGSMKESELIPWLESCTVCFPASRSAAFCSGRGNRMFLYDCYTKPDEYHLSPKSIVLEPPIWVREQMFSSPRFSALQFFWSSAEGRWASRSDIDWEGILSQGQTLSPRVVQELSQLIWGFPGMGVPQNGRVIMENPIKVDDLGVPLFQETSI